MRMPIETMENSQTDVVLKSNHIDFALTRLVELISKRQLESRDRNRGAHDQEWE